MDHSHSAVSQLTRPRDLVGTGIAFLIGYMVLALMSPVIEPQADKAGPGLQPASESVMALLAVGLLTLPAHLTARALVSRRFHSAPVVWSRLGGALTGLVVFLVSSLVLQHLPGVTGTNGGSALILWLWCLTGMATASVHLSISLLTGRGARD